jgi:hypothetical protein
MRIKPPERQTLDGLSRPTDFVFDFVLFVAFVVNPAFKSGEVWVLQVGQKYGLTPFEKFGRKYWLSKPPQKR